MSGSSARHDQQGDNTMSLSNTVLRKAESALFEQDKRKGTAFDHEANYSNARLYHIDDEGVYSLIDFNSDVYELLSSEDASTDLSKYDSIAIAVITYGWAAPLTDDDDGNEVAPSQHKDRKRVRVFASACEHGSRQTFLRFEQDPDHVEAQGEGTGSMADAISALITKSLTKKAGNK